MASIIYYCKDIDYIQQSIDDLLDNTFESLIDEIIICLDSIEINENEEVLINIPTTKFKCSIIKSSNIGRSRAWSEAVNITKSDDLVFVGGPTKFSTHWLENLLSKVNDNNIVSPIIHTLDTDLWSMTDIRHEKFGWRWDLQLYSKPMHDDNRAITVSSYCFAIKKNRLLECGGFDVGMVHGCGEDIELSYRNIALGGECLIVKDSIVGSAATREPNSESTKNLSRIVNIWFTEYMRDFILPEGDTDCGKINDLVTATNKRVKSNTEILNEYQPELFGIKDLRKIIKDRSLAIISPGASMDYIDKSMIYRHELIIGIDYMGMLCDCDFVVSDTTEIITELTTKYSVDKMILPTMIANISTGRYELAKSLYPKANVFELGNREGMVINNSNPPFINANNISLTILHMALYFEPNVIYLYGYDNSLLYDKSHIMTSRYYGDGKILPNIESTHNKYKYDEFLIDQLKTIAIKSKIPVIRINHL